MLNIYFFSLHQILLISILYLPFFHTFSLYRKGIVNIFLIFDISNFLKPLLVYSIQTDFLFILLLLKNLSLTRNFLFCDINLFEEILDQYFFKYFFIQYFLKFVLLYHIKNFSCKFLSLYRYCFLLFNLYLLAIFLSIIFKSDFLHHLFINKILFVFLIKWKIYIKKNFYLI
jgi:hypothetical protein